MAEPTISSGQLGSKGATTGIWHADPYHTQVEFSAKHLGMMTVRGHFADVKVTGQIVPAHPEATAVEVTIQTASIRTNHEQRDNDIRASNFLDVANYPTITFKSTKIEPLGGDRYTLTGDLTIKGVTKPVTLAGVVYGEFNDPMMGHRIGYSAEGKINRKDFGMSFSMMLDGKFIVSDEVQLMIEGEIVEQKPEQAAPNA
ncbi:MAG TPA: YceI family protein [Ktedonobacterales bacterium]|nr:YceI family protein [Ktedonobacterales bacterium]